jgi:hypothetical protein
VDAVRRTLVISPRRRFVAFSGWLLLTLLTAAAAGYAVWQMIGPTSQPEGPDHAPSTDTGQEQATVIVTPPPSVIRLTPDPSATATPRPHTAAPTPSATRAGPELVSNGSFEGGSATWYLEGGAAVVASTTAVDGSMVLQISSGGGYADQLLAMTPGDTYLLTGSGRVTAQGDSGILGVVYRDATGARLTALEPSPLVFTRTRFREKQLVVTVPAGVAEVKVYAYKEAGPGLFEADAISVRPMAEP